MNEIRKRKVVCPKCKNELEIEMWDSIDIPYDIEQKEKVMNNTFFKVRCDKCQLLFPIGYKCIYNDMEQRYLVVMIPQMGDTEKEQIENYNKELDENPTLRLAQKGYKYRIVRNDNELREKIVIFDEGLDDRYIETMKVVYASKLRDQFASKGRMVGMYFDKQEQEGYQFVILFDKGEAVIQPINMDIYHDMTSRLKETVEANTPEKLCEISSSWAIDVMMSRER